MTAIKKYVQNCTEIVLTDVAPTYALSVNEAGEVYATGTMAIETSVVVTLPDATKLSTGKISYKLVNLTNVPASIMDAAGPGVTVYTYVLQPLSTVEVFLASGGSVSGVWKESMSQSSGDSLWTAFEGGVTATGTQVVDSFDPGGEDGMAVWHVAVRSDNSMTEYTINAAWDSGAPEVSYRSAKGVDIGSTVNLSLAVTISGISGYVQLEASAVISGTWVVKGIRSYVLTGATTADG
jgi:hypothetical protein